MDSVTHFDIPTPKTPFTLLGRYQFVTFIPKCVTFTEFFFFDSMQAAYLFAKSFSSFLF